MAKRSKKAAVEGGLDMDPKRMRGRGGKRKGKVKGKGEAPDGFLFNVDSKHAKRIRALAEAYQRIKRERIELLAEEVRLKGELIAFVMKSEAAPSPKDSSREIRAADVVVKITPDEKMKVKVTFDGDGDRED